MLNKKVFTDHDTLIDAAFLNSLQDAVVEADASAQEARDFVAAADIKIAGVKSELSAGIHRNEIDINQIRSRVESAFTSITNLDRAVSTASRSATEAKADALAAKADSLEAKTTAEEASTAATEAKVEATEAKGMATEATSNALEAKVMATESVVKVNGIEDAVFEKTEVPPKTWTESELRDLGYVADGKYAKYDTGGVITNELYKIAVSILVKGYDRLRYSRISIPSGQNYAGMHFKTRSNNYVGGEKRLTGELGYVESVIDIPEDAEYAYISIRADLNGWYAVLESDEIKTDKIAALDERLTAVEQESGKIPAIEERLTAVEQGYEPHVGHVGGDKISNASIRCVKEISYEDGTAPTVHYYVVQDVQSNKFYKTVDFSSFYPMFEFTQGNPMLYKFGVLENDDIIAVFRTESLNDLETHSDDVRRNPIVFKAADGYTAHLVDFGTGLKPSGWLSSVGFKTLPTGETLFCEYTRPSVATANAWKITGDATDPGNWRVVKSFTLSGEEHNGFKHCHAIMHDFFTGVVYLTTGDDNVGASVWASTDKGENWRKLTISDPEYNEKYFRILNYTFLKDYVYWSTDSGKTEYHFIFRAPRDADGIVDYSQVEDLIHLPEEADYYATYGTAYIPELDMILLVERSDANTNETVPVRAYLIEENRLVTLGQLEAVEGRNPFLGFRTEYTEYYPDDGCVKFGFGPRFNTGSYINGIKGFGNSGRPQSLEYNVNNLYLKPYCIGGRYGFRLGTCIK